MRQDNQAEEKGDYAGQDDPDPRRTLFDAEGQDDPHDPAGDQGEAAVRALIFIRLPEGKMDERGFAAIKEIGASLPAAKRVGFARFKEIVRNQYLMLLLDEERAMAALPKLLYEDRREWRRHWTWCGACSAPAATCRKRAAGFWAASKRCSPAPRPRSRLGNGSAN